MNPRHTSYRIRLSALRGWPHCTLGTVLNASLISSNFICTVITQRFLVEEAQVTKGQVTSRGSQLISDIGRIEAHPWLLYKSVLNPTIKAFLFLIPVSPVLRTMPGLVSHNQHLWKEESVVLNHLLGSTLQPWILLKPSPEVPQLLWASQSSRPTDPAHCVGPNLTDLPLPRRGRQPDQDTLVWEWS